MLSISALTAKQGNYYLQLANDKYYTKGGEPEGEYFGEGAEALGFHGGHVDKKSFNFLLNGTEQKNRATCER